MVALVAITVKMNTNRSKKRFVTSTSRQTNSMHTTKCSISTTSELVFPHNVFC